MPDEEIDRLAVRLQLVQLIDSLESSKQIKAATELCQRSGFIAGDLLECLVDGLMSAVRIEGWQATDGGCRRAYMSSGGWYR